MSELTGVREKTVEDYIRDLANPELTKDGKEADRIIDMLNNERAKVRETQYHHIVTMEREISRLNTEIKALVEYIQLKSLYKE